MNLAEFERYFEVFNALKDNKKEFPNSEVIKTILHYNALPQEERTNDDGIAFLIANSIRLHRGLAYPG